MATDFDAVVIGSGVGGMCAAALLANAGRRVLLAEKRRYLGGRFSTVDHDGFKCATGGLAVPVGRDLEQVCEATGIHSGVKQSNRVGVWLDGEIYSLATGGTRGIIQQVAQNETEVAKVIGALHGAMTDQPAPEDLSFRDWLNQRTENPRIHGIFQATIASLLTVNSWELPAAQYFRLIKVIAPLRFGFIEGGSLELWKRMAQRVVQAGGEVWTAAPAEQIHTSAGRIRGVTLRRGQQTTEINAPVVLSNIGPAGTLELLSPGAVDPDYAAQIQRDMTPTAIMWLHFASDELLMDYSAISVGCSRRVNMIDVPSFEAEGVAPPGKHLYTVGAAPLDSLEPGDIKAEFDEVMKDLEDIFPDFSNRATVLTKTCYRGKWPGFRTLPHKHVGHGTPIANLYNVGDAACPSGYDGSMGAAKSARLAVAEILEQS
ncbi:MAG: NAD(P)/FAD-dependent oxidoreductase [Gammaproteobacteria bacterium]|nr:NAD(P)/FAD-dependent oxidoreductase [Gammaproteobacteria bacterium]